MEGSTILIHCSPAPAFFRRLPLRTPRQPVLPQMARNISHAPSLIPPRERQARLSAAFIRRSVISIALSKPRALLRVS